MHIYYIVVKLTTLHLAKNCLVNFQPYGKIFQINVIKHTETCILRHAQLLARDFLNNSNKLRSELDVKQGLYEIIEGLKLTCSVTLDGGL
jgi:hypothetical protein